MCHNASGIVAELLGVNVPFFVLEDLLNEAGRWDFVKQAAQKIVQPEDAKYVHSAPVSPESYRNVLLRRLAREDPSTEWPENDQNAEPSKVGPYLQWIVSRFARAFPEGLKKSMAGRFWQEDFPKVISDLKAFDRVKARLPKEKRDINKIGSFEELFQVVEPHREELETKDAEGDADKIYDKDGWVIVVPKTKQASCAYGAGTRWCTASTSYNYFDRYNNDSPLFIVIQKGKDEARAAQLRKEIKRLDSIAREEKPLTQIRQLQSELQALDSGHKWQFHFSSNQFMNELDHPINIADFVREHPFIGPPIASYLEKSLDDTLEAISILDPSRAKAYLKEHPDKFKSADLQTQLRMVVDPDLLMLANENKPADIHEYTDTGVWVLFHHDDLPKLFKAGNRDWVAKVLNYDVVSDNYSITSYDDASRYLSKDNSKRIASLLASGAYGEEDVRDAVRTAYARAWESAEADAYYQAVFNAIESIFSDTKSEEGEIALYISYKDAARELENSNQSETLLSDALINAISLDLDDFPSPEPDMSDELFNENVVVELDDLPENKVSSTAQAESI